MRASKVGKSVLPAVKPEYTGQNRRKWPCLLDMVCDARTGKLRETLVFSVLGKVAALYWFSIKCYHDRDSWELWALVMCVLTAHAMFSQVISAKFGPGAHDAPVKEK